MEWKVKFEAEMLAIQIAKYGPINKDNEDKPTGKQLFLSNRAGLEEALIAAGEQETSAQLAAAMSAAARRAAGEIVDDEEIAVKEDLFLEDYDDLDDLDDLLEDEDDEDEDYVGSDDEEEEDV